MAEEILLYGTGPRKYTNTYYVVSGGLAGVVEHLFMFPVDTIKTKLQAATRPLGLFQCIRNTLAEPGGMTAFYRGVSAGVMGSFPAHAVYFTVYERVKERLTPLEEEAHQKSLVHPELPLSAAAAGACATIGHDLFHTPFDVVKQRLQLSGRPVGLSSMVTTLLSNEGLRAFFLSVPTTIMMNIPFSSVHFATYETVKKLLSATDEEIGHSFWKYTVAGGAGGACAGIVSNPFDVIKTRQQVGALRTRGVVEAFRTAVRGEGWAVFTRGLTARILYFVPSAAIQMTAYEIVKQVLRHIYFARLCRIPNHTSADLLTDNNIRDPSVRH